MELGASNTMAGDRQAEPPTVGQGAAGVRTVRRGFTLGLMAAMAAVGGLSLLVWSRVAREGRSQPIPAAATENARPGVRAPHTPHEVKAVFLQFLPLGDHLDVEQALLHATGQTEGGNFPGRIAVAAAPDGYQVTVAMPVNLPYLLRTQEIITGRVPGASDLKSGQLLVNGNNHVWAVDMDPRTDVATYRFRLSRDGRTLWALNWNARGIISQNDSLN